MKNNTSTMLLILVLLIGLSLLLYPSFSNYWNSFTQTKVIDGYSSEISNLNEEHYQKLLNDAMAYNEALVSRKNGFILTEQQKIKYNEMLNIASGGVMGYIEIPSIKCTLPIYHGTDENVLQIAVGHLEWSSLPVGGESSHCVLSGHRGLPSSRLFTDLDELVVGDIFMLRVLDEVLTYEVDAIHIVLPHETELLTIEEGKDQCTLITCTPYGINTHRLLVRGHRIDNLPEARTVHVTADAVPIEPLLVAPIVASPILLVLLIGLLLPKKRK